MELADEFIALVDSLGGDVYQKDVLDFRKKLIDFIEEAGCNAQLIEDKGPW